MWFTSRILKTVDCVIDCSDEALKYLIQNEIQVKLESLKHISQHSDQASLLLDKIDESENILFQHDPAVIAQLQDVLNSSCEESSDDEQPVINLEDQPKFFIWI